MFRLAILLGLGFAFSTEAAQVPDIVDITNDDFSEEFAALRIRRPEPQKDPKTSFLIGGVNQSVLLPELTEINGVPIAKLEARMRPRAASTAGFLGPNERLLTVLEGDNRLVLDELGLSHQELSKHLYIMAAMAFRQMQTEKHARPFVYHGRTFKVGLETWFDTQDSPFDDGTSAAVDVYLGNLDNGQTIWYSLLVPMMMDRYGFYEGRGTKYRVEPTQILKVLDFVKAKRESRGTFWWIAAPIGASLVILLIYSLRYYSQLRKGSPRPPSQELH